LIEGLFLPAVWLVAAGVLVIEADRASATESAAATGSASPPEFAAAPLGRVVHVPHDIYRPPLAARGASPAAGAAADAQRWVDLAGEACARGEVAVALEHAARALASDPDQPVARRLLGHQQVADGWAGHYAARMIQAGRVWHTEFGWIKPENLARFQQGLRPAGRRWIDAELDAQRHATINEGWTVRSDHFLVVTNHSRAAAVRLISQLETIYLVWLQRFGQFAIDARELQARWEGTAGGGARRRPFRVIYHQTRDQYNAALRRHQPQIDKTLGIYFDHLQESHFFAGDDQDPGTLRHEVVHQLFQESRRAGRNVAATANAWAVEGVACYFESLAPLARREQGAGWGEAFELGGATAGRMPAALQRRLADGYYVPLAELTALGMTNLQSRPDLGPLYSQMAGFASFLVDARQGAYRPALRELLERIYAKRDTPGTLEELVGKSLGELDRQYETYLRELATGLARER
jgi:hypothetical protein